MSTTASERIRIARTSSYERDCRSCGETYTRCTGSVDFCGRCIVANENIPAKIEHSDIRLGDTIVLANEPATVTEILMQQGWANTRIRRPLTGTIGRYMLGSPVLLLSTEA